MSRSQQVNKTHPDRDRATVSGLSCSLRNVHSPISDGCVPDQSSEQRIMPGWNFEGLKLGQVKMVNLSVMSSPFCLQILTLHGF